jgi:hypothetical protein
MTCETLSRTSLAAVSSSAAQFKLYVDIAAALAAAARNIFYTGNTINGFFQWFSYL